MDPLGVESIYKEAVEKGNDPLVERAVENSPFYNRLVKEELIEEAKVSRMKRLNPEAYGRLKDVENLVSTVDYNHNFAIAKLEIASE